MEKILVEHPWLIVAVLIWTIPWKGAALWRAARRAHPGWFITMLVLNTLGILDILYLFVFSPWLAKRRQEQNAKEQQTFAGPGGRLSAR